MSIVHHSNDIEDGKDDRNNETDYQTPPEDFFFSPIWIPMTRGEYDGNDSKDLEKIVSKVSILYIF